MTEAAMKTDSLVQRNVLDELRWDPRIRVTDVGVEVHDGIVTLTGKVGTWSARLAAQEAAHRISGVLDVVNDVLVEPRGSHQRDDTDLAKAVRGALEWDVLVPDEKIRTTVSNGVVALDGTVDSWAQYDDAARAVRNLAGVREVRNQIVVDPSPMGVSEHTIQSAIEGALARHAEHASRHVSVALSDGEVILRGEVTSAAERRAAEGAARGTPGVRKVDNRLRVHG